MVTMPVVRVGEMRVVVAQGFVAMPVRVRGPRRYRRVMRMLMVQVVLVLVVMLQRFVPVPMFVALAQVQPHADGHQCPGNQ